MVKISALTEVTQAAPGDFFPMLDVFDTAQGAGGSVRKIRTDKFFTASQVLMPTGSNDDVIAQAALNALPPTGGKLVFGPGTFIFNNEVSRSLANVTIEGFGFSTTIKWGNNANKIGSHLFKTDDYWVIKDLLLDGNKANNTGGSGIYIYQSARVILGNLYLHDFKENGIHNKGTSPNASSHATQYINIRIIDNDGYGVFAESYSYDLEFLNTWIGQCNVGMRLQDSNQFLSNLHIWGCTGSGLELRSTQNRITNAYLETNGGNGANLFNAHNTSFVNCNIWKNSSHGISSSTSNRLRLIGSEAYDNNGAGVRLTDSLYWKIVGNDFYDDQTPKKQTYGVQSSGSSDYGLLTNNSIRATDHLTGNFSLAGSNNTTTNNIT